MFENLTIYPITALLH